jgi:tellurite methyltransferase
VDISSVALQKSKELAKEYKVEIETVLSPMEKYDPGPESFDAIVCFYYIDKKLNKKFLEWLKPGGILIYESHTTRQRKVKGHEKYELSYLLQPSELLTMFPEFRVLKYEEPLHVGEFTSSIIVQKPVRQKP